MPGQRTMPAPRSPNCSGSTEAFRSPGGDIDVVRVGGQIAPRDLVCFSTDPALP